MGCKTVIITSVKRRGGQYDENVQFNYTKGNACAKIAEEVMKGQMQIYLRISLHERF